jgi:putative DNA primase/helicase
MSDEKVVDWKEALERRKQAEAEKANEEREAEGSGGGISSNFIWECCDANELGDGILFAEEHKGKFIFNHTTQEWMIWKDHYWARDETNQAAAAVEGITPHYLRLLKELDEKIANTTKQDAKNLEGVRETLLKRIRRLRSERGRTNCLKFAASNSVNAMAITSEMLDRNPWLLGVQNGVINLKNGELQPGRQSDFISKVCPHEWKGKREKAEHWERSLLEILKGDDGLVAYIKRLFGYSITGLSMEHIFPIFWGDKGRNGKGTIFETILYVLGPLAAVVQSEMLLDNWKTASSSGPSADVMALFGLRVAIASETKEGRYIDSAKVKWFCGADTLVGRHPYDKYLVRFSPTHTLFLQTNNVPHAPADDHAFWARVHLIPFELSFVENPQAEYERPVDKMLREKLRAEASGILAWLVEGCLEWQSMGLDPPPIVMNATNEQRREEDYVADFIDDCCYIDRFSTAQASKLYNKFSEWYQENHDSDKKKTPSQRKFGLMMIKKFKKQKDGVYYYHGLGLLDN